MFSFMKEHGIIAEYSHPGVPQENGTAERSNRVVLEKSRTLIQSEGLPFGYWYFAAKYGTFLANQTAMRSVWYWP